MPIYEYECKSCGHRTELLQKLSDPPLESCPECQGTVRKVLSAPGLHFKGSGWYVTDYAKKSEKPSSKTEDKKTAKPESTTKKESPSKPATGSK